jgi:hypothetical protein
MLHSHQIQLLTLADLALDLFFELFLAFFGSGSAVNPYIRITSA